jgi:hypothetical protein
MNEYFMLECLDPDNGYLATVEYYDDRYWNAGRRFNEELQAPITALIKMRKNSILPELNDASLPIMTRRLYEVINKGGVSNLDVYPVILLDKDSGKLLSNDYLAFNIIGLISAADMEKSEFDPNQTDRLIAMNIDSLTIDESKTRGALMFRLAEAVNGIVIHESVKYAIEATGIETLTFIPPEEWVG